MGLGDVFTSEMCDYIISKVKYFWKSSRVKFLRLEYALKRKSNMSREKLSDRKLFSELSTSVAKADSSCLEDAIM